MGADLFLRPLFDWRGAVASPYGPPNPTTRHVLHALSLHMSAQGDSCFPKVARLVEETGLSKRAVIQHLALAAEQGWLGKQELSTGNGQSWRRIEYFALIPDGIEQQVVAWRTQKRNGLWNQRQAGDPGAPPQAGARGSKGGAPGALPNIKGTNKNLLGDSITPYTPDFLETFKAYPKRAGNNPKQAAWKAYNARIKEGVTPEQIRAGVDRYAVWCDSTGKTGTEFVLRASTFLGTDRGFEQSWQVAADVAKPLAEPRCIYIPEGQGGSGRCMEKTEIATGALEINGRKIHVGFCARHYQPPVRMAGGDLLMHPVIRDAMARFQDYATQKLTTTT